MEKHGLIPKNLIDQQQNKSKYPAMKVRESPCKSVAKNQNENYWRNPPYLDKKLSAVHISYIVFIVFALIFLLLFLSYYGIQ